MSGSAVGYTYQPGALNMNTKLLMTTCSLILVLAEIFALFAPEVEDPSRVKLSVSAQALF